MFCMEGENKNENEGENEVTSRYKHYVEKWESIKPLP